MINNTQANERKKKKKKNKQKESDAVNETESKPVHLVAITPGVFINTDPKKKKNKNTLTSFTKKENKNKGNKQMLFFLNPKVQSLFFYSFFPLFFALMLTANLHFIFKPASKL